MSKEVAIIASNGGLFDAYKVLTSQRQRQQRIKKWPFSLLSKA
ncbi:hypothetical protein OKW24_003787 [Peribacillus simplex]|nr:hypothetical protein [Peribacillus simplex]